jgi:hypothetical protein
VQGATAGPEQQAEDEALDKQDAVAIVSHDPHAGADGRGDQSEQARPAGHGPQQGGAQRGGGEVGRAGTAGGVRDDVGRRDVVPGELGHVTEGTPGADEPDGGGGQAAPLPLGHGQHEGRADHVEQGSGDPFLHERRGEGPPPGAGRLLPQSVQGAGPGQLEHAAGDQDRGDDDGHDRQPPAAEPTNQGGSGLARLAEQADAGSGRDREQGAFEDALDDHVLTPLNVVQTRL